MPPKKLRLDAEGAKVRSEVQERVRSALRDKRHLNGLAEVIDGLRLAEEPSKAEVTRAVASLRSLTEAFYKMVSRGDLDAEGVEDEAGKKVAEWLRERMDDLWDGMAEIMLSCRAETSLGDLALSGAFR